jgi:hypothetical protein
VVIVTVVIVRQRISQCEFGLAHAESLARKSPESDGKGLQLRTIWQRGRAISQGHFLCNVFFYA